MKKHLHKRSFLIFAALVSAGAVMMAWKPTLRGSAGQRAEPPLNDKQSYGPPLNEAIKNASPQIQLNAEQGIARLVYFSSVFSQRITVGPQNLTSGQVPFLTAIGAEVTEEPGGALAPSIVDNTLYIEQTETDLANGDAESYTLAFSAALEIVDLKARCAGDYVVLLKDRNGGKHIERWTLVSPVGAWEAIRSASNGIGQAIVNVNASTPSIVGGGTFVPITDRPIFPAMRRSIVVDAGNTPADTQYIAFDADGRYVIIAREHSIEQVVLVDQAKTVVVSDADRLHSLVAITDIVLAADPAAGRLLLHRSGGSNPQGILWDTNNDGTFDSSHLAADTPDFYSVKGQNLLTRGRF